MKQEAISYLSTEKENLIELSKYIYNNPEESYKEFKTSMYITEFLEKRGFTIEKNFQNISTAFKATIGSGEPNLCFICEYDAIKDKGHLTAHNTLCSMQVGAAIALSKVLEKLNNPATITVLGCPGEYLGGVKETFMRQGVFEELDTIFEINPNIITSDNRTSCAVIPLEISFESKNCNKCSYSSVDALLLLSNILKTLEKSFSYNNVQIDYSIPEANMHPFIKSDKSILRLMLKSNEIENIEEIQDKIKSIANFISELLNVDNTTCLYQPPSKPLKSNNTLNRLFSNNLKESGIINTQGTINSQCSLNIGSISETIPTISPLISIVDSEEPICYGSTEFSKASIKDTANEIAFKTSIALFCTAIDLIEKPELLSEAKQELNTK